MNVQTNNIALKKEIKGLIDLLIKNGSHVDSGLSIEISQEGGISLHLRRPPGSSKPLIRLKSEHIIPVAALNTRLRGDSFEIDPDRRLLNPLQIEIGTRMIEIYNAAGKVAQHKAENPWIQCSGTPRLLELLLSSLHPGKAKEEKLSFIRGCQDRLSFDEFVVETFMASRTLARQAGERGGQETVIMPIADYLDHDYRGSPYAFSSTSCSGDMGIFCSQPFVWSQECYARYGSYDAVDTFVNYGFIDREVPFVRSIPLEIEIGDRGKLLIDSSVGSSSRGENIPKPLRDIRFLLPNWKRGESGEFMLSHIFIAAGSYPHATKRIIRWIIEEMTRDFTDQEFVAKQTAATETKLVDANVAYYEKVLRGLDQDEKADSGLKNRIRQLLEIQLNKLFKYSISERL